MQHTLNLADQIHQRALDAAGRYRKAEAELIEILQQAEQHRVFLTKGHSSLFLYVVKELGLSEGVAYNLISVSRKAREIPELKAEIQSGAITLSNARKIVPVLNPQNKSEWLEKASTLSERALEKEIVKVRPEAATCERASYVTPTRVKLELGLFENDMKRLRRVQDLLSSTRKRPVSLEEIIVTLTGDFLNRHDPLERAKRQWVKKGFSQAAITGSSAQYQTESVKMPVSLQVHAAPAKTHAEGSARTEGANDETRETYVRKPIAADILHQINLRDQRGCQFVGPNGRKCGQTRWTEIHHKTSVSQGGKNTLENLTTLCSAHHGWIHAQKSAH